MDQATVTVAVNTHSCNTFWAARSPRAITTVSLRNRRGTKSNWWHPEPTGATNHSYTNKLIWKITHAFNDIRLLITHFMYSFYSQRNVAEEVTLPGEIKEEKESISRHYPQLP